MDDNDFKVIKGKEELELTVKSPSPKNQRESQKIYNRTFSDALNSGSIVRARLDDVMKEQKLWDDKKEQQYQNIQKNILDNERALAKGGIPLSKAKKHAKEMQELRGQLQTLISERTTLDSHTAEGQADNAKFNFLVSCCVVYKDTNQPYFEGYEDYNKRAIEPAAIIGAQKLANMLYGLDDDFERNLPENKFLHKYKFVDDELRPINSDGRLVDDEGRLIDEYGRFIDDKGNRVDIEGNPLDDDENYKFEFEPFLDDNGKPIKEDGDEEKPKPKTRAKAKKAVESS
tara:strand:- start:3130 stop:3990 length:861 start_codon:yes stop_codon:yes gene_type:complete